MTQELTEPEVALEEAADQETPLGPRHLHWVHRDGGGHWLVRGQKKSSLCGTIRCRKVFIQRTVPGDEVINPVKVEEREQFGAKPEVFLSLKPSFGPVPVEGHREV